LSGGNRRLKAAAERSNVQRHELHPGLPMKAAPDASPDALLLTKADYVALSGFRHGVRRYLAFAEAGAKSAGLTGQQHQALLAIKAHEKDRMTVGELADQLMIKNHSAGELVNRLMKARLVKRSQGTIDRRRVLVSLTRTGEGVLAALSQNNFRRTSRRPSPSW
jgi:DNA-binding MarR family transcriptional regulator